MFVCPECGESQAEPGPCSRDGAPLAAADQDVLLGAAIGAYRVARLLGVGGMGRVYKAVHPQIGSRVAIKVLSRECSDRPDLVERFFAEARAVNLIRYESIVNVLDLATLPDGRPYIVMEYLDGAPLASLLEAGLAANQQLPLGGVARLVSEVLDALGAAHAKGIVHRDLKPDNIFVTPAGRAKVLDFGIAKLHPELGGKATHTGSLLGTPQYMSPEQAAGRTVDHRADIYAMGVILFECVTLTKPFVAESLFDLLRLQVEAPPPSPRARRPDLPPALEEVIYIALAKQPDQRFASAGAMNVALQQATMALSPDQWTPIIPPTATPSMAGWQRTPPASWGTGPRTTRDPPHGPTVSAGQVTAPKPDRGKTWLVIGAVALLIGGGITAAVVAHHSEPSVPVVVADRPAPPAPAPVELAKPPTPAPMIAGDPTPTIPTPPSTPPPITPPPVPASPSGWFERHAVQPPSFDPKRANVDAFIAFAIAEAKQNVPDAEITWIDAAGVYPDGHADLSLPSVAYKYGAITVRFISPSHSGRDPSVPRGAGARTDRACEFRVTIDPDGGEIYDTPGPCKEATVPRPRCTVAAIWKKALAKRRDLRDAVAAITYTSNIVTHKVMWMFDIHDNGDTIFSEQFPDDC